MMTNKLINFLKHIEKKQDDSLRISEENLWANIYHDSIRGYKHIEELSLNIGRWAGSYSFFYVLNRTLKDYKPKRILEFGLGESSKFISTYIKYYNTEAKHTIIEHDQNWIDFFKKSFVLAENSTIVFSSPSTIQINNYTVNSYSNLDEIDINEFDIIIVDGKSSPNLSRGYIIELSKKILKNKEIIIILDDTHRNCEKETEIELSKTLKDKDILFRKATYSGVKSLTLFVTEKYKYATSF